MAKEPVSQDSKNSHLSLIKLAPNVLTLSGICIGLFALKAALVYRWEHATIYLIVVIIIDWMDGALARKLNATSQFGAELDSLADFVNFSVVPALMVYFWYTHEIKAIGWAAALFFTICGAIRLARFNVNNLTESESEDDAKKDSQYTFFQGVPAPAAAALLIAPIMIEIAVLDIFTTPPLSIHPVIIIAYSAVISLLMISQIPTLSLKQYRLPRRYVPLTLAFLVLVLILTLSKPWLTMPIIGILYLATIPFTYRRYR